MISIKWNGIDKFYCFRSLRLNLKHCFHLINQLIDQSIDTVTIVFIHVYVYLIISFCRTLTERSSIEETEKSLKSLITLAANPECVSSLVEGLGTYMKLVQALTEHCDSPAIEHAISLLFSTILHVS